MEFRLAVRGLLRRPAFTFTVCLTLALVIGAAVAIASVVQGMLLRPLPFHESGRLIAIDAVAGGDTGKLATREVHMLAEDATTLTDVASFYPSQYNVTGDGAPEALVTMIGTANLFRVFGVRPLHGAPWPDTLDWNLQYVVVLGHSLWQRRYGSDPAVVGRSITLDGAPYTVAAVLPPGFDYPLKADLYRAVTNYTAPEARRFTVVARMKSGVSPVAVQAELDAFSARFAQTLPETNRGVRLVARPLRDVFVGPVRPYLWLLAVAVAAVLIVACANLGNMMLARALDRRSEIAVRLALGAGRAQIVRLAFAESAVLALLGGGAGYLLGGWAVEIVSTLARFEMPAWIDVRPDWRIGLAASVLSLAVTSVVALVPAIYVARGDVREAIVAGSRRVAGSRAQRRMIDGLVAGQAAFAVIGLVAAALMWRTMTLIAEVDPGFTARSAVTFRTDPPWTRYGSTEAVAEFYRRAIERLSALPGVTGAASNMTLPFGGVPDVTRTVLVEGQSEASRADERPHASGRGKRRSANVSVRSGARAAPGAPWIKTCC